MKNGPMDTKEFVGYDYLVFPRPVLYDLLLAKILKEKIVFKKKVLKTEQSFEGVSIHCSDNTIYDGDILVGADSAYSAMRQNLYKQLAQEDKQPFSDAEQMNAIGLQATDDESFRNSEWTPEANEAIIRDAANFKIPHGTIGSLIEQTPKEYISRVFLKDKLFETWFSGLNVLIGDGKMS
ncbi:hypothetical protein BG006_010349 [Podila minutissima]|uniref:Uncharacterized protein n=1 Tax=Podila minutissima TaxID=64525 RepID=A0A9P5VIU0_9FUNG|nr:hypothetical protein BG006_010349 [Podila minutissima]